MFNPVLLQCPPSLPKSHFFAPVEAQSHSVVNNRTTLSNFFIPDSLFMYSLTFVPASDELTLLYSLFIITSYCNFQSASSSGSQNPATTVIARLFFAHLVHQAELRPTGYQAWFTEPCQPSPVPAGQASTSGVNQGTPSYIFQTTCIFNLQKNFLARIFANPLTN